MTTIRIRKYDILSWVGDTAADLNSIYINAIGRALEGFLTIFISGLADYSREVPNEFHEYR